MIHDDKLKHIGHFLEPISHPGTSRCFFFEIQILKSQRDVGIHVETAALARKKFRRSSRRDHRRIVGRQVW